jgi:acetyl-CoA C-acetyltransferase
VGVAQLVQRDAELAEALDPLTMLEKMAREAADECGAGVRALGALDTIAVVPVAGWKCVNPPRALAEALSARPSREIVCGVGGEFPVAMFNELASRIAAGRSQVALMAGCNNLKTLRRCSQQGVKPDWNTQLRRPGLPEEFGKTLPGASERERHYGLAMPTEIYPIFENALRATWKLDLEEHRVRMGKLFHPFTQVAAANPYAWFPVERGAEELTTVAPENRMVGFPYTKYLNAVLDTDQASAVLLMAEGQARQFGVAEEDWVYWRGGASAVEEAWWASERPDHGACPAMKTSQLRALERASVGLDAIDRFDLYSCFPAAVGMACEMLGLAIDDARGLTVTGGLPYFGGPANNYTTHALAQMVTELREGRGTNGLVTGNGWYLTKHAASVLSTLPPEGELQPAGAAAPVAGLPTAPVEVIEAANGRASVETYTVLYGRDQQPERGIVVGRLEDGRRFLANTREDRDLLEAFAAQEAVGRVGAVRHHDGRNVFDPV